MKMKRVQAGVTKGRRRYAGNVAMIEKVLKCGDDAATADAKRQSAEFRKRIGLAGYHAAQDAQSKRERKQAKARELAERRGPLSDEKLEAALKLSATIAIHHPTHPLIRPCSACALLVLADAIQDLRLSLKRLRKQHDLCSCGLKRVDGVCGDCNG